MSAAPQAAPVVDLSRVLDAAARAADALTTCAPLVAGHFTCREADAVAELLRTLGQDEAAETWLDGHAAGDDEPDDAHRDRDTAPALPAWYKP